MAASREKFLLDIDEIIEDFFCESGYPNEVKAHTKRMIEYMTLSYDKTMVPVMINEMTKIIRPNISDEEMRMAESVGWIYQLFEAHACLQDDYLDDGDVRYGKLSWPKLRNYVRTVIVHDDSLLRTLTFFTIEKMFSHSVQIYVQLLAVFFDFDNTLLKSGMLDQHLIVKNLRDGKLDWDSLSLKNYNTMASLKGTAFFFLPVFSALILAGYKFDKNSELYKNIKTICNELGLIAQVVDDYYDIFHPKTVAPAASSDIDIKKGQFTWLFLMVKEKCTNKNQIEELLEHYGRDTDESVVRVKALYESIDIHNLFHKYYEDENDKIEAKIDNFFAEDEVVLKVMKWFVPFVRKFIAVDALEIYY